MYLHVCMHARLWEYVVHNCFAQRDATAACCFVDHHKLNVHGFYKAIGILYRIMLRTFAKTARTVLSNWTTVCFVYALLLDES